jgi:hypothetical protein
MLRRCAGIGRVFLGSWLLLAAVASAEERVVMSYPLFSPEPTHRIVAVDAAKREVRIDSAEGAMLSFPAEGQAVLVVASKKGGSLDTLVRVNVAEILEGNVAVATFGPGALPAVQAGPAGIGKPAGIGAIHPVGDAHVGLFAFADGSVQTHPDTVDTETLRTFLTRAGGEVVDRSDLSSGGGTLPEPSRPPLLKVIAADDGTLWLEID